jgi:hypothetical protein
MLGDVSLLPDADGASHFAIRSPEVFFNCSEDAITFCGDKNVWLWVNSRSKNDACVRTLDRFGRRPKNTSVGTAVAEIGCTILPYDCPPFTKNGAHDPRIQKSQKLHCQASKQM